MATRFICPNASGLRLTSITWEAFAIVYTGLSSISFTNTNSISNIPQHLLEPEQETALTLFGKKNKKN